MAPERPVAKNSILPQEPSRGGLMLIPANDVVARPPADAATSSNADRKKATKQPRLGTHADVYWEQPALAKIDGPELVVPPPPARVEARPVHGVVPSPSNAAETMQSAELHGDSLATVEKSGPMRQNYQTSEQSVNDHEDAPLPADRQTEKVLVAPLLSPFYLTNPNPTQPKGTPSIPMAATDAAPKQESQIREEPRQLNVHGNQLPITTSDELLPKPTQSGRATLADFQQELPTTQIPNVTVAGPAAGEAAKRRDNALSALAEENAPSRSADNGWAASSSTAAAETESTLEVSSLLLPFHITNSNPLQRQGTGMAFETTSNEASQSREAPRQLNPLSNQSPMTRSDNQRPRPAPHTRSNRTTRDQGWPISMPEMMNPFTLTNNLPVPNAAPRGVALAAYQEELPLPPHSDAKNADPFVEDPTKDGASEPSALADAEKLGEAPEDTSLEFLRESTVLLKPGESQLDVGIEYLLSENDFPILLIDGADIVGADDVDFRIRELAVPLQYRFGLLKRMQGFIGGAVGWSNTQVAIDDFEAFESDGGFGDLDFGATLQLVDGHAEKPHLLATISATAPTGGDPFGAAVALAPSAPSLGQGFWSISGSTLCIHTYDPLVFYYGVGGEHFFSRRFEGLEIEPGNSWNYSFGAGFAVNDRVTLSTRFRGAYVEELRVNRERVFGTNVEPMSLRMAATISKPKDRIVEPFVEFGLTDGAVSNYFGITWTY
jgi:hypothetical protein